MTPQVLKFLAQLLLEAPQLVTTVESLAREHLGASEDDLRAARDEARAIAAKLGRPDVYFDVQ